MPPPEDPGERLIYQNECLLIEVEELKRELEDYKNRDFDSLEKERDTLQQKVQELKNALVEKNQEVHLLHFNIDDRLSAISKNTDLLLKLANENHSTTGSPEADRVGDSGRLKPSLVDLSIEKNAGGLAPGAALKEEHSALLRKHKELKSAYKALQSEVDRLTRDHDAVVQENVSLKHSKVSGASSNDAPQPYAKVSLKRKGEKSALDSRQRSGEIMQAVRKIEGFLNKNSPVTGTGTERGISGNDTPDAEVYETPTNPKGSLELLHTRMNGLLSLDHSIPEEIKNLIELMLDANEKLYEDLLNELAIKEIQYRDREGEHIRKVQALHREISSLREVLQLPRESRSPSSEISFGSGAVDNAQDGVELVRDERPVMHTDPRIPFLFSPTNTPAVGFSDLSARSASQNSNTSRGERITCPRCTFMQKNVNGYCRVCGSLLLS